MMQNLAKTVSLLVIIVSVLACSKSVSEKSCEKVVKQIVVTGVSLSDTIRLTKECEEMLMNILACEKDTVRLIRGGIILIENGYLVQDSVFVDRLISFIPRGLYGYISINNYYNQGRDISDFKIAFIGFLGKLWDLGYKKSFEVLMSYVGYGDGSIGGEYERVFSMILEDDCKYVLEQLANYSDKNIFHLASHTSNDRSRTVIKHTGEQYPNLKPMSLKYLKTIIEWLELD